MSRARSLRERSRSSIRPGTNRDRKFQDYISDSPDNRKATDGGCPWRYRRILKNADRGCVLASYLVEIMAESSSGITTRERKVVKGEEMVLYFSNMNGDKKGKK